jgi:ABC-2 type transport system permease protein
MRQPTPSTWGGAWTIIRSRWQVARNSFWRGGTGRKIGVVAAVVSVLAFTVFLTFVSRLLVRALIFIAREEPDLVAQIGSIDRLFAAVPSLALGIALLPLLFSSVSWALSTFYLSRDLDMLLVTPVPIRSVFLARFAEGLAGSWLGIFVLLGAPLIGYGLGLGYGALFVIAVVIVLLLLPLLPTSLGTLLTMLLVRVVPAQRLREIVAVVGGLFGAFVWLGTQFLGGTFSDRAGDVETGNVLRFDLPFLPTSWGARTLIAAGTGNGSALLGYGALYLLATLGVFAVCVVLAERLYATGWATMTAATGGRVRRGRDRAPLLRGPAGAILRKDIRTLPRDLQQVSQLVVGLFFTLFWLWRFTSTGPRDMPLGGIGATSASVFTCILLASNLGLSALSREGRSMWLLQLAPISPWTILRAKWVLAYMPFPLFGVVFAVFLRVVRDVAPSEVISMLLQLALIGMGVAGITTGLGGMFPRFDWDNPRNMTTARANFISFVAYGVYTALMLGLLNGAPWLATRWGWWVYVAAWSVAIALTVLAAWVPLQLAAKRMRMLEV